MFSLFILKEDRVLSIRHHSYREVANFTHYTMWQYDAELMFTELLSCLSSLIYYKTTHPSR